VDAPRKALGVLAILVLLELLVLRVAMVVLIVLVELMVRTTSSIAATGIFACASRVFPGFLAGSDFLHDNKCVQPYVVVWTLLLLLCGMM
jgi:hypothetical protein